MIYVDQNKMGLDSVVKKKLREFTPSAFVYRSTIDDVHNMAFQCVIIDMNVELFRKPVNCATGMQWYVLLFLM